MINSLEPWTTTRTPAQTAGAGSSTDAAQWPELVQDAMIGGVERRRRSPQRARDFAARCRWAADVSPFPWESLLPLPRAL
jgi:hypothetical protein